MEDDPAARDVAALSEGQVVAMAALAWLGALAALPVPLVPTAVAVATTLVLRRPLAFMVCVALLATSLGARAEGRFEPVAGATLTGVAVSLVDDPRPLGATGWRASLRLPDGRRVQATAFGTSGFRLGSAGAGDRFAVDGRLSAIDDSPWSRSRHILGRLDVAAATPLGGPTGWRAGVESVRDRVVAGADLIDEERRPLYLGLVIGDDRLQPEAQRTRFAAAGLAHLLAVSGQNVAFVLTVARPLVLFAGRRSRLALTIAVLVAFAVATRLEPSVLRATATSGVAAVSAVSGHRQEGIRLLGLAVTGLLLVDPFLVHSLGFQLSVSASAGILLLGPLLASRLPGPPWLVDPLAVTISAQLAVLPLLSSHFGPVSAISVLANLLAGWAAGAVMVWGLTGGVVAGIVGGAVGRWLQRPPEALLWWLDEVAAWAARVPAPAIGLRGLAVTGALFGLFWVAGRQPGLDGRARGLATGRIIRAAVVIALAIAGYTAVPRSPPPAGPIDGGGWWSPRSADAPSALVITSDASDELLVALVRARITEIDVVVTERGSGDGRTLANAVTDLASVGVVLAPPQHRIVGARRVTAPVTIELAADATVTVAPDGDGNRLTISIGSDRAR